MKLKRLSLQGYKTFASRTSFEFDEGITAIVGPNGSGKSNIADAIRWVLGEQSYSTLRGRRTIDMIFAGSQQRARAGMAQAILTLDNKDGWLPIDYAEIEIGRRAHRSGDNEYLLNGQKVRLRDITDLLAKSGLAQRTYTIIGQGLIDQALSLRADERRMLFEEAAGVGHYKQRRAETLRRLEETSHNLERVQDIIAEIRPRLNSLRRQANRARNREQVAADLRHLLQIWYGHQWERAKSKLRVARQESEDARQIWTTTRDALLNLQQQMETSRTSLRQSQERLGELDRRRDEVREKLENIRREVAVLSERKALLKRQLDEHKAEIPALVAQKEKATEELEQAFVDLKAAQEGLDRQNAQLRSFEAGFTKDQAEIDRWRENLNNLQKEHRQTTSALEQTRGRMAQLKSELRERLDEASTELELSAAEDEVQSLQSQVAMARQSLARAEEERVSQTDEHHRASEALNTAIATKEKLALELTVLERSIVGLESQMEILDQSDPGRVTVPDDVAHYGQLVDVLEIPAEYQQAIRAALSFRIQTWLLKSESAIWRLRKAIGEGHVLAIARDEIVLAERPAIEPDDNIIGWADGLVVTDPSAHAVAKLLLGNTLVVQNARHAYALAGSLPPGFLAVSTDGVVVHSGRLVELGSGAEGAALMDSLEQRSRISEELATLYAQQDKLTETLSASDQRIASLETALLGVNTKRAELEDQERAAAKSLAEAESALKLGQQQFSFHKSRVARIREGLERLEQRLTDDKSMVVKYESSVTNLAAAIEDGQSRLDRLPVAETAETRKQLQQNLQAAQTILAGRQAVVDSRQTTLSQVVDQLNRRRLRLEDLRTRWRDLELESKEADLSVLQREMDSLSQLVEPLRVKVVESQQKVANLDRDYTKIQRTGHDSETRYTQARIELTQQESQIENLKERIQGDLGLVALTFDDDQPGQSPLPIAEVVEELPVVESLPDDIEESIGRYRGQLTRIGAVNPEAPAEYDETLARYEFLVQQTEDLSATKERLQTVINDLDVLTSTAFAETVEKVNEVFGVVFKRLFGGGSAQLALTDPDDLTNSGVDIVARLPRRREQGLALLSGGERSLTAAALVFSLLKVSPTPFCVLDEVDAMLDEANVNRFRGLLAELSERTQFIVITHNRGTVQAAESVYGVSMGADSVSQVISIKPEEYVQQHS